MKTLIIADFKEEQIQRVRNLGYDVIALPKGSEIPYEKAKDVEIMVSYKEVETLDFSKMPNLKLIQLTSIGFDQVPKKEALQHGVKIANNKGCFSIQIGEWIVSKILEIYKDSKYFYRSQNEKHWEWNMNVMELNGKTVGFFGTGSVATEGAKRLAGFNVEILGMNTNGRDVQHYDKCYSYEQRYELAGMCDVLVCALPFSEKSRHIFNKAMFEAMKPGSILINVGRGESVNVPDLIEAIESGKLRGAALDVFETEPLPMESKLWRMDSVYVSSHNSWVSEYSMDRIFETAFLNLENFIKGRELGNIVDLERGY